MTDPMDTFKALLKNNPPPAPNKFVENQSIEAAMAAFDKKNASSSQGMGWVRRLMGTARMVLNPNDGASMKTVYKIGGSVCAATLAIALLSTSSLNNEFHAFKKDAVVAPSQITPVTMNAPHAEPEALPDAPMVQAAKSAAPVVADQLHGEVSSPLEPKDKKIEMEVQPSVADSASRRVGAITAAPAGKAASVGRMSVDHSGFRDDTAATNSSIMPPEPVPPMGYHDEGRDKFEHVKDNPLKIVSADPVSTFSIDVDTASYSFMRASLNNNVLPQKDSVRIEEMVNYFPYDYTLPKAKTEPFASSVSVMPTPWNTGTKLIHIGIKGYELPKASKPHSNLVFLIDTSGSMNEPNKLPLLKNSMKLLLDSLQADDTVAIVTYAGSAGVALEPTKILDKVKILNMIDSFNSGGSTAGAEGIRQAYELAERNFDTKGVNRVILATDGDFNVGITDPNELKSFIERKRNSGVFLSVLGFGQGNYNDAMMQTLAQNGNGNAAYIDSLSEARKVLVEEAGSTLFTIAKDVKIQVEFNPAKVSEYRLIGYETRMLNREDFNNDKIDAGEIGAGHTVTAIYEITPTGSNAQLVDELRYGTDTKTPETKKDTGSEYAFLKIRYKLPNEEKSKLLTTPIDGKVEVGSITNASTEAKFATSVAAFGQLLRGEAHTKDFSYDDVVALAQSGKGADNFGYRAEFITLVRLAKSAAALKPLESGQR
jgi:Ca-activated chloride channel homolog